MEQKNLANLGFNQWFQERQKESQALAGQVARVTAVDRHRYLVRNEHIEMPAELAGKFTYNAESPLDLPCVGDWVVVEYHNGASFAVIHALFPRQSVLRRKAAGKKIEYQLIAANIDIALIIQSCEFDFNVRRLERYLTVVRDGGIEPVVVLSKIDLIGPADLERETSAIRQAGVTAKIITLSNTTRDGLSQVEQELEDSKTYCLLGSSGVGKTTLVNHLIGEEIFDTKAVRAKDGKGRHATTRRQLIVLKKGAMLIDNPGLRELGVIDVGSAIEAGFSDISELASQCRFRDCTHTTETDCAIREAIEDGRLDQDRYRSYMKLSKESDYHQMSYVEKRRKDRAFGRFVKSVMKDKRKKR